MRKSKWVWRLQGRIKWQTKKYKKLRNEIKQKLKSKKNKQIRQKVLNIKKYGRVFLSTFPETSIPGMKRKKFSVIIPLSLSPLSNSPVVILQIISSPKPKLKKDTNPPKTEPNRNLAYTYLNFEKKVIIIDEVQALEDMQQWIDRFKSKTKTHWATYLAQQIEKHARNTGYAQLKLSVPEELESYRNPATPMYLQRNPEEIRESMRKLYYGVANSLGMRKEGKYFVKDL